MQRAGTEMRERWGRRRRASQVSQGERRQLWRLRAEAPPVLSARSSTLSPPTTVYLLWFHRATGWFFFFRFFRFFLDVFQRCQQLFLSLLFPSIHLSAHLAPRSPSSILRKWVTLCWNSRARWPLPLPITTYTIHSKAHYNEQRQTPPWWFDMHTYHLLRPKVTMWDFFSSSSIASATVRLGSHSTIHTHALTYSNGPSAQAAALPLGQHTGDNHSVLGTSILKAVLWFVFFTRLLLASCPVNVFILKIHDLSIGGKDKTALIWLMPRVDLQKMNKEPEQ